MPQGWGMQSRLIGERWWKQDSSKCIVLLRSTCGGSNIRGCVNRSEPTIDGANMAAWPEVERWLSKAWSAVTWSGCAANHHSQKQSPSCRDKDSPSPSFPSHPFTNNILCNPCCVHGIHSFFSFIGSQLNIRVICPCPWWRQGTLTGSSSTAFLGKSGRN